MEHRLPSYDELPVREGAPPGSAWGLWDDERFGCLNLLTAERVAAAARLVEPGDSILLGPGTTTLALANRLRTISELTVVTNSLLVIQAFAGNPGVEVVSTGGILRRSIHALVGPSTEQGFASLKATRAFISGNGLTAERGLTTPNMLVATCDRALAAAGQQVIVLVDHTKVGLGTLYQTVAPSAIDVLFTDAEADAHELDRLRQAGVDVRVV